MFSCYGALLPLILLLLMSSSALLPVLAGASVKSAKISADGSKQKTPTHLSFFVQKTLAVTMVPVAIIESLMVKRKSLFWIVLTFAVANSPVEATCSTCFGYSVGCSFDANGKCPAIDEPSSNRAIIAGTGSGAISLAKCISPRFLRMFTRAELSTVITIASKPPPGTPVTITAATKLKAICVYLEQGLVSLEQVNILYAGFVDDENDALKRKGLEQRRDGVRTRTKHRHGTWHMVQGKQRSGECTGA
mmetsp:Transcript_55778/g.133673  ORF Transcript_55778/g.133673 Transcript_55778/m.133673 type:complete len:248 (+) Transcript_55778:16-759(+)